VNKIHSKEAELDVLGVEIWEKKTERETGSYDVYLREVLQIFSECQKLW
jgi:hypothetical protein